MKRLVFLILFILIIPFCYTIIVILFSYIKNDSDNDYKEDFKKNHKTYAVDIPEKIDFAGETVPVNMYDVRERLDRELLLNVYWQSNTVLMIKRAYRWFPVIVPILKQNKIPEDFKYVALIESEFINKSHLQVQKDSGNFLKIQE